MRIVLRDDVDTLGQKGDLVEVADGYARNFLVPRGLAMPATRGVVRQSEAMRRNRARREARDRDAATKLATRLAGTRFEVKARSGEGGRLFGSVTSAEITAVVEAQTGIELDRRNVELAEPLKELGPVEIAVRLHPGVPAVLQVEVVAE